MKTKPIFKIFLDVLLLCVYTVLMFDFGTGALFHEVAGIAIGVLFILHYVINLDLLRGIWKGMQKGTASPDKIILFILDAMLPLLMFIDIGTGVLMAKEWFSLPQTFDYGVLFTIHNTVSWMCLWIMAAHLLLHGKYIVRLLCAMKGRNVRAAVSKAATAVLGVTMSVFVLYFSVATLKTNDSAIPAVSSSSSSSAPSVPSTSSKASSLTPSSSDEEEKENSQTISQSSGDATGEVPTLQQYLGNLFCSGCSRHCSLAAPHCGKGQAQAQTATQKYNTTYGILGE